jgi:hypothetical protein
MQGRLVWPGFREIGQSPNQSMKTQILLRRDGYTEQTSRRLTRGHEHRPGRGSAFVGIFCVEWGRYGRFEGGKFFRREHRQVTKRKRG